MIQLNSQSLFKTSRNLLIICLLAPAMLNAYGAGQDSEKALIKGWKDSLNKLELPNNAHELFVEKELSLDGEDGSSAYLWDASRLKMDIKGNFLISDPKWSQVFMFSPEGKFIRTFGKKGMGPGELINPFAICLSDGRLLVSDTNRYDLQFFNFGGGFDKGFRVFKAYLEILLDEQRQLIYAAPLLSSPESKLLDILDYHGGSKGSLIPPRYRFSKSWNLANFLKMDFLNADQIAIAFVYFPVLQIWSRGGRLISETTFHEGQARERSDNNFRWFSGDKGALGTMPIVAATRCLDGEVYLLQNYPVTTIFRFDAQGTYRECYWFKSTFDFRASDFCVQNGPGNQMEFIVLENRPENKILSLSLRKDQLGRKK